MNRTQELDEIRENFLELLERIPETGVKFREHYETVYQDGVFDAKTKRLIALCGGIVAGCKGCILGQAAHAIENGASANEILAVCAIALSLGGTLAGSQSAMVLELLKEKEMI
jgi:alkylhydroperoxidase/carboxymuconolactone decarboxylase family protein YurZ